MVQASQSFGTPGSQPSGTNTSSGSSGNTPTSRRLFRANSAPRLGANLSFANLRTTAATNVTIPPSVNTGGTINAASGGNQPPPPPPKFTFARSPFDTDIDLSTKEGVKLYESGCEALPCKFSGKGKDLLYFVENLKIRATKCRWDRLILSFVTPQGRHLNLLDNYGEISMEDLKDLYNATRSKVPTCHADVRPIIDSDMMAECINNSLEGVPAKKLLLKAKEHKGDGPMMFKQIVNDTFVATTNQTINTKCNMRNSRKRRRL